MVDQWPSDEPLESGELLPDAVVQWGVARLPLNEPEYPDEAPPTLRPKEAAFVRALELNGFTVSSGALRRLRLLDLERRIPARVRFAADSLMEGEDLPPMIK